MPDYNANSINDDLYSYAHGALERLGFGPQQCADLVKGRDRGIVYVRVNCFGHSGPMATSPGFDGLAQFTTGVAHEHVS